jgi:hypothetical protein
MKDLKHIRKFNESEENLDNETSSSVSDVIIKVPDAIKKHMDELGIPDKNQSEVFEEYIHFLLGTYYGQDLDSFMSWSEESDNIVDYLGDQE